MVADNRFARFKREEVAQARKVERDVRSVCAARIPARAAECAVNRSDAVARRIGRGEVVGFGGKASID